MTTGTASPTKGYEATTPAGIRVYFQSEPKRLYRVDDIEVPSVTSVLGVLEKGGLSWWGMQVGIDGTLEMIRQGLVGKIGGEPVAASPNTIIAPLTTYPATKENVTELLKAHKLTVNNTLTKAGDRGTSVHRALEEWGESRTLPDPGFYPPEEEGYIRGLLRFLEDLKLPARPKMEMEVMVGSVDHGFAGRYDMACTIAESEFVTHCTPVRGETRSVFEKGRWLFDLKTSRKAYTSHHFQLSAYELASFECGYGPTVGQAVVVVSAEGGYTVTKNRSTAADFLAVKGAYDAVKRI